MFVGASLAAGLAPAAPAAQKKTTLGFTPASTMIKRVRDPMQYVDYFASLGFGGGQVGLRPDTPVETIHAIRRKAEASGLYLEGSTRMARDSAEAFEARLKQYQEMGVDCFRSTCLSGRRYETFSTLGVWKEAVAEYKRWIARSVPVCEKLKMRMGIENHKDWTIEDFLGILKEYESEYVGVCLDFGNNVSLLDEPHEVVDALAPYAVNTHFKDVGVQPYEDGFLLAQVALGTGALDLKRIAKTIRSHHPKINFCLEMMARNPLKIPCLTDKYWATFPNRSGRYLARALRWVEKNKQELHNMDGMSQAQKAEFEQENFRKSIAFARDKLGLA
jgi:sugar phosphate isomerase/epimerase